MLARPSKRASPFGNAVLLNLFPVNRDAVKVKSLIYIYTQAIDERIKTELTPNLTRRETTKQDHIVTYKRSLMSGMFFYKGKKGWLGNVEREAGWRHLCVRK